MISDELIKAVLLLGCALIIKVILSGLEFNFISYFKYGTTYWLWYNKRESFEEFIRRKQEEG